MDVTTESQFHSPNTSSRFLKLALPYLICGLSVVACNESRGIIGEEYSSNTTQFVDQSRSTSEILSDISPPSSAIVLDDINSAVDPAVMRPAERLEDVNPFKIGVFGDSIVNGYLTCGGGNPWPTQLEIALNDRVNGIPVKITNFSVPGETITSPTPQNWYDANGNRLGGNLVERIFEIFPRELSPESLPDMVIIVPSINEFILTSASTPEEAISLATNTLDLLNNYLRSIGISKVLFTEMLRPSDNWIIPGSTTNIQDLITLFNNTLAGLLGDSHMLQGNNLDLDNPIGSDIEFFNYNDNEKSTCLSDGLHPTSIGQSRIAQQILNSVLDLGYFN